MAKTEKKQASGLDLADIGDLSNLLGTPEQKNEGRPLELQIALIDEDPHQPRSEDNPGFSQESLAELAETIKQRGVKTPISVREHPKKPGRYLVNHGARRLRASKLAEKTVIPAFIDNDYNEADQVVENLQRNELTAREIADFIGRELARSKKKGEIAISLGKSAAFVSQHVTLLDLPEPIAKAFNEGRTKDVTLINELVKLHKSHPDQVASWLADESLELGRQAVKLLKEFLAEKDSAGPEELEEGEGNGDVTEPLKAGKEPKQSDPYKLKKPIVRITDGAQTGRMLLSRRPSETGFVWVCFDDGRECEQQAEDLQIIEIIEG